MTALVQGQITITPALTWAEVSPTGRMVMDSAGYPQVPAGTYVKLVPTEELVANPDGTLHKFTFAALVPSEASIPSGDRETFRAGVQSTIAAFPGHTFAGTIRFRGDLIDDQWRIGVAPDGVTVRRQIAQLTWVNA
jgi:hypothetical protein